MKAFLVYFYQRTFWLGNIRELQPFECIGNVLYDVVCPGINKVLFGMDTSDDGRSLLMGLLVNGSRSYNLNMEFNW